MESEKLRFSFPLESISLIIDPKMLVEDIIKALNGFVIVLHSGTNSIPVNLCEIPMLSSFPSFAKVETENEKILKLIDILNPVRNQEGIKEIKI
jgi:hypothetical protein